MLSDSCGIAAGDGRAHRRVLIVDPYEPLRSSLARLFERKAGWTVVGTAGCLIEAAQIAAETRPDVIVADCCTCPDADAESLKRLISAAPGARVVGYSLQDDRESVCRFLEAGGHGFVSKIEPAESLLSAIERIASGKIRVAFRDAVDAEGEREESQPSA